MPYSVQYQGGSGNCGTSATLSSPGGTAPPSNRFHLCPATRFRPPWPGKATHAPRPLDTRRQTTSPPNLTYQCLQMHCRGNTPGARLARNCARAASYPASHSQQRCYTLICIWGVHLLGPAGSPHDGLGARGNRENTKPFELQVARLGQGPCRTAVQVCG